jgi:hypothetical protein
MKKVTLLITFFSIFSCTTSSDIKEIEYTTKDVEIIFSTTEPNHDEIMITYYDIDLATDVSAPYEFRYDTNGNSLPIKIIFDNYKYKFLDGEVFRNNFSTAELKVEVYVEEKLFLEEASKGTSNTFARVKFNFNLND